MNLWLIPFFPLIGFLINGLLGRRLSKPIVNLVAVGSVAASFAYVLLVISRIYPITGPLIEHDFTWIQSGTLNIGFDLFVDRLTALMLLIVTGVGLLIHTYSIALYVARRGLQPVFLLLESVHVFHADSGPVV